MAIKEVYDKVNAIIKILFLTTLLSVTGCASKIQLYPGIYVSGDDYLEIDPTTKHIHIKISDLPPEVYFSPYEYDLIPDTLNGESVYEISLQNRISSKQAYFGDECIFYYTRDGRVIMRSTNRNIRDISLPQEIIFVKKE